MKSVTTSHFRQSFDKLPSKIQAKARKAYRFWKRDPQHPSLNFKQIHAAELIYSIRIGLGYRALGVLHDDTVVWFWIGSHQDYNEMIKRV